MILSPEKQTTEDRCRSAAIVPISAQVSPLRSVLPAQGVVGLFSEGGRSSRSSWLGGTLVSLANQNWSVWVYIHSALCWKLLAGVHNGLWNSNERPSASPTSGPNPVTSPSATTRSPIAC